MFEQLASIGSSALDSFFQYKANDRLAEKNRDWQEYMSNTAYQRAATDLEKAGLNRVLALGNAATTPSGATASIEKPSLAQTGIMASSAKQQIAQSKAEEALIHQREDESVASEARQYADEKLALEAAVTNRTQAQLNDANTALAKQQARLTSARATQQEKYTPVHDAIGDAVNSVVENLRSNARDIPILGPLLDRRSSNSTDAVEDGGLLRKIFNLDKLDRYREKVSKKYPRKN